MAISTRRSTARWTTLGSLARSGLLAGAAVAISVVALTLTPRSRDGLQGAGASVAPAKAEYVPTITDPSLSLVQRGVAVVRGGSVPGRHGGSRLGEAASGQGRARRVDASEDWLAELRKQSWRSLLDSAIFAALWPLSARPRGLVSRPLAPVVAGGHGQTQGVKMSPLAAEAASGRRPSKTIVDASVLTKPAGDRGGDAAAPTVAEVARAAAGLLTGQQSWPQQHQQDQLLEPQLQNIADAHVSFSSSRWCQDRLRVLSELALGLRASLSRSGVSNPGASAGGKETGNNPSNAKDGKQQQQHGQQKNQDKKSSKKTTASSSKDQSSAMTPVLMAGAVVLVMICLFGVTHIKSIFLGLVHLPGKMLECYQQRSQKLRRWFQF